MLAQLTLMLLLSLSREAGNACSLANVINCAAPTMVQSQRCVGTWERGSGMPGRGWVRESMHMQGHRCVSQESYEDQEVSKVVQGCPRLSKVVQGCV
jgi:hypothetical protein